ncbi:hypothetical protein GCM10011571_17310 [Marinithermofilum abyssi]|uniref:AAA-like domain-containing protein n=1 Tax=Marinithermofilum abyssi TaxID=1571185 RepID=A0A8J2Y968_9BACL|nr:ATP-binding protein [Marinithermofilum abyssi]GGE16193.1 hypothetical protein GCM10011571_17310 [Marinithermofilum abyssi]
MDLIKVKYEFPTLIRSGNMIVNKDGQAFGYYHVPQINYDFLSDGERIQLRDKLKKFLNECPYDIGFKAIPVPYSPWESMNDDPKKVPGCMRKTWKTTLKNVERMLRKLVPSREMLVLKVNMESVSGNLLEEIRRGLYEVVRDPSVLVDEFMGGDYYRLPFTEWERFEQAEQDVYNHLTTYFLGGITRLGESEVLYLTERCGCRGVSPEIQEEPMDLLVRDGYVHVSKADVERGMNDVDLSFKKPLGMVRWEKDFPEETIRGYFQLLTVSWLPPGIGFPNKAEVFRKAKELPFPVEIDMDLELMPNNKARKELKKKWDLITGQINHTVKSKGEETEERDIGKDAERKAANEALDEKLEEEKTPLFKMRLVFCVWGDTPKEVKNRRGQLISKMKEIGLRLEIPRNDQKNLYHDTLPGAGKMDRHYIVRPTAEFVASFMPLATTEVGDPAGIYLGTTIMLGTKSDKRKIEQWARGNTPVFMDESRARDHLSKTSSSLIMGSLGRGKTMLKCYIVYRRLQRGVHQLLFEPKNELWSIAYELSELAEITNIVSVGNTIRDKGKFDPLLGIEKASADERILKGQLAESMLLYLADEKDSSWAGTAIGYAVHETIHSDRHPSMIRVLEHLRRIATGEQQYPDLLLNDQARDDVARIHASLKRKARQSQAQLLFGDGDETPIDISNPLTIIQMQDLQMPKPGRPDYRLNMTLLIAMTEFARRFVNQPTPYAKGVVFEENHRLMEVDEGEMAYREFMRTCRSKDADVMTIIHNAKDLRGKREEKLREGEDGGEDIRSNLGYRFCFSVGDETEAASACDILGIEPNEDNISEIMNLDSGEWIMRDLDDRVAKVKMDLEQLDPRLFNAFDHRPEANRRREKEFGHLREKRNTVSKGTQEGVI